jgi:hypothetical protein
MPINKFVLLAKQAWLDSLSAFSVVHGYAIIAQPKTLQVCRKQRRYV